MEDSDCSLSSQMAYCGVFFLISSNKRAKNKPVARDENISHFLSKEHEKGFIQTAESDRHHARNLIGSASQPTPPDNQFTSIVLKFYCCDCH